MKEERREKRRCLLQSRDMLFTHKRRQRRGKKCCRETGRSVRKERIIPWETGNHSSIRPFGAAVRPVCFRLFRPTIDASPLPRGNGDERQTNDPKFM